MAVANGLSESASDVRIQSPEKNDRILSNGLRDSDPSISGKTDKYSTAVDIDGGHPSYSSTASTRGFPTIPPDNRFRQAWQIWMAFPLIWTGTVMPYVMCFIEFRVTEDGLSNDELDSIAYKVFSGIIDACFWADLILTFFCQYHDPRGNLIKNPKHIAKGYLQGWFWFDLIACLPSEVFELIAGSGGGMNKVTRLPRLYRVTRLARLMRMTRMLRIAKIFRGNPLVNIASQAIGQSRAASVLKFMTLLVCLAHLLGCIWYLIGALSANPIEDSWIGRRSGLAEKSDFTHWVTSVYFVITVFTSVGFGDIHPVTDSEVVFGIFLMMIGAVVHSIIVSEVIAVVTRVDSLNAELAQKRQAVQAYSWQVDLKDQTLESRCVQFAEFSTRAKYADSRRRWNKEFDWRVLWEVIRDMPEDMRQTLHNRAYDGVLVRNKFFQISRKDDKQLALLASAHLKSTIFEKMAKVFSYGDQPTGLFLVQSGILANVAVPTERGGVADVKILGETIEEFEEFPYQLFGCKGYCGEWELIYPHPRVGSCRAECRTSCLLLEQQAFIIMVTNFPKFLESFKPHARRRERLRLRCFEKHKLGLDVEVLAITRLQSFFRGILVRQRCKTTWSKIRKMGKAMGRVSMVAGRLKTPSKENLESVPSSSSFDEKSKIIVEDLTKSEGSDTPTSRMNTTMSSDKSPGKKGSPSKLNNGLGSSPSVNKSPSCTKKARTNSNASHASDSSDMPVWAVDMQKTVQTMDASMETLRKGQEEMERMVQQLYFLSCSGDARLTKVKN